MVNGGHLGRRVSDLLDGQLSPAETEAAWAHVHACHACRDDVEREGWVKTRLSSLSFDDDRSACAPDHLKGALLGVCPGFTDAPQPELRNLTGLSGLSAAARPRSRRGVVGFAAIGGGAAGAAVMGVLALGAAPSADLPVPDRRQQQQPVAQVSPGPTPPRAPTPVRMRLPR